jgi:signal transduction histidine kinase
MWILNFSLRIIDWFIPDAAKSERSELNLARNFVFTHISGPLLSQSICVFLYLSDPHPGFACWTVIVCTWLFWTLPFVYKWTGKLQQTAIVTVELLAFTSLFGAYYYGGVSSPFLPWLIVSLLLGFFYLSKSPSLVAALFTFNILVFCGAHYLWGFPELVAEENLATVGWISILSATIYMSWMAIYYANMMSMSSEIEHETESHRETALRLREAKDMADVANRAKSIFLAKMSHELRTPLNAVIGFSEILLENVEFEGKGEGKESKKADLKRINAAGQHLLSLVTDVLDLSKIESNFIEMKPEQFDLGETIRGIVANVEPMVLKNGNKLIVKCADDLGIVSTDATKLRQATLNLLSNAAKFTEGGTVTLSVYRRKSPVGDWIEIQVLDTGIGIAQSELSNLFQNFGQANRTTSTKYGGTGLGLALSKKLCGLMGGGITATSEPGRGSCFTIRVLAWMNEETLSDEMSLSLAAPEFATAV